MNLDDLNLLRSLDTQDMLGQIDALPDQLQLAWQLGLNQPLPEKWGVRQVVLAGMGASSNGADLIAAYASPICPAPIFIHRNYGLPAFARGPETLVIASSLSGNTEETISAFQEALDRHCSAIAITTGGELSRKARETGSLLWTFEHTGQARSAIGFTFALLLAALHRTGLLPDPAHDLDHAVTAMRQQQQGLGSESPVFKNPAKRLAGQLMGRWVVVTGSDHMEPVARRWKAQLNEMAKAWGQVEVLPEADHNTLAGLLNPESLSDQVMALFLRAPSDHPRNRLRSDLTRQAFMVAGFNTDFVDASGDGLLAHMLTAMHFGDYCTYYLALAYGVDPALTEMIGQFKQALRNL